MLDNASYVNSNPHGGQARYSGSYHSLFRCVTELENQTLTCDTARGSFARAECSRGGGMRVPRVAGVTGVSRFGVVARIARRDSRPRAWHCHPRLRPESGRRAAWARRMRPRWAASYPRAPARRK
jgi:hypothetical protein